MYTYIDSLEDLSFLSKELLSKPVLAVDTEFRRTTKDNMRLALLQINDGEEIYIIDTVILNNPKDHCDFLFSESVLKIFHSCKEDLEAIYSWTGKMIVNLFDTQLAYAFLDGDYSIGYQGLVEKKFDIVIEKKETRSNWIRRPLSESQLDYAASDVEYLIHLYEEQNQELIKSNKINWFKEDIALLMSSVLCTKLNSEEPASSLSKSEENNLLFKFNEVIVDISKKQGINPTLFFSKKNQKNFIRSALLIGPEEAYKRIANWRESLIREDVKSLLLKY